MYVLEESAEGRAWTKENDVKSHTHPTQSENAEECRTEEHDPKAI
jgi:hypothetical protein